MNPLKKPWHGRNVPVRMFLLALIFLFAWQLYEVRELIVLETMFTLIVLSLIVLGLFLYCLGVVVDLAAATAMVEARVVARAVHTFLRGVEELTERFWHGGLGIRAHK